MTESKTMASRLQLPSTNMPNYRGREFVEKFLVSDAARITIGQLLDEAKDGERRWLEAASEHAAVGAYVAGEAPAEADMAAAIAEILKSHTELLTNHKELLETIASEIVISTDSLVTANQQLADGYDQADRQAEAGDHQWADERRLIVIGLIVAIVLGVVGLFV